MNNLYELIRVGKAPSLPEWETCLTEGKKTSAVLELAAVDCWVCILELKRRIREEKQGQDG